MVCKSPGKYRETFTFIGSGSWKTRGWYFRPGYIPWTALPQFHLPLRRGFLTNPEEAELLQTSEYQQKVAYAVALGIDKYLKST